MQRSFKTYPVLIAMLVLSMVMCFIYARRQIDIFGLPVNTSGVIVVFDMYILEIIGECYGYEYSRQAVWINMSVHLVFLLIILLIAQIPYSTFMHKDLVYSYKHLIDISWLVAFGSLLGNFFGDVFSAKFIPRTKVLLKGRYTLLRIYFSQVVSESIVTSSYFITFLTTNYTFSETLRLIIFTVLVKCCISLLLLPLALYCIKAIKKIEHVEGIDVKQGYQLFAFAIDNSKIEFRGNYSIK